MSSLENRNEKKKPTKKSGVLYKSVPQIQYKNNDFSSRVRFKQPIHSLSNPKLI